MSLNFHVLARFYTFVRGFPEDIGILIQSFNL